MVDSIKEQLQHPVNGVNVTYSHLAGDKIVGNRDFFMVCKTDKLQVSKVKANS